MTRAFGTDPMHDIVAGDVQTLLNTGVVSGGEAFRDGVVGSGRGVPRNVDDARSAAGLNIGRMAASSLVTELDKSDELDGAREV